MHECKKNNKDKKNIISRLNFNHKPGTLCNSVTCNMMKILFFLYFSLFFIAELQASHAYIYAGPETYYLIRNREGGTTQSGRIDGIRVGFERIKRYSWYLGTDYIYSVGKIDGENRSGRPIKSEITDSIFEMRLGYTLKCNDNRSHFLTIFGGYGYFHESNSFYPPTPIPFTFTDTFNFSVAGFLSGFNFTPLISMGINFKARFMLNGKSKVTDDPFFEDVTLTMRNEAQFRLEIPLAYCLYPGKPLFDIHFVPFYEYRHFGGQEDFPFDYIDTRFHLIGMRFAIAYRF